MSDKQTTAILLLVVAAFVMFLYNTNRLVGVRDAVVGKTGTEPAQSALSGVAAPNPIGGLAVFGFEEPNGDYLGYNRVNKTLLYDPKMGFATVRISGNPYPLGLPLAGMG